MGPSFHSEIDLGAGVLRAAALARQEAPHGDSRSRLQMDSHPLPLLERQGSLYRKLPRGRAEETVNRECPDPKRSCGTPVQKSRRLSQSRRPELLTEKLR